MIVDPNEFGKAMGALIRDAVAPLHKRIEELEAKLAATPPRDGKDGRDGKDAEPVLVADVVAELVRCPDLKPVLDLLTTEAVAKHFEAHPVRDGASATPEMVAKAVADHLQAHPIPAGKPGRDGLDVKDMFRAEGGRLMAVMTDGTTRDLGVFVGDDGAPGRDGADFTDVEFEYDGERGLIIRGRGGEIVKRLPIPIDKGYHREGMAAERGDILTSEGSAWIALRDTKSKPCMENSDDWRLFARRGRDAGPVRTTEPAPAGPVKLG